MVNTKPPTGILTLVPRVGTLKPAEVRKHFRKLAARGNAIVLRRYRSGIPSISTRSRSCSSPLISALRPAYRCTPTSNYLPCKGLAYEKHHSGWGSCAQHDTTRWHHVHALVDTRIVDGPKPNHSTQLDHTQDLDDYIHQDVRQP